jgi:cytochrome c oxidase assembly protein subunit 15
MQTTLYDLRPLVNVMAMGALIAMGILSYWWMKHRQSAMHQRCVKLTALVLFLTFDLVVFGAFTRLTDSGLGCPDWPGCYGHASPIGAKHHIDAAEQAMPTGPVTHEKAWIEMIHRYLATAVGVLLIALCAQAWLHAPAQRVLATVSLIWVMVQGAFGALTVTLKLMPLVVTLHLLGGLGLLALLTLQLAKLRGFAPVNAVQSNRVRPWLLLVMLAISIQIALGGWVSTNYAVLACQEFPSCLNGSWWPPMDFEAGFELFRPLGKTPDGEAILPAAALTAIHMVHRMGAVVVVVCCAGLLWSLKTQHLHRQAGWLLALLVLQISTGISNVIFQWPLLAALLHTAGAALWVIGLVWLWMSLRDNPRSDEMPDHGTASTWKKTA